MRLIWVGLILTASSLVRATLDIPTLRINERSAFMTHQDEFINRTSPWSDSVDKIAPSEIYGASFRSIREMYTDGLNEAMKVWPLGSTVYVLPDLHGDFLTTVTLLHEVGAVDDRGRWRPASGGQKSILIQLGDIADRGPDSPAIYELFWRLAAEASAVGDEVYQLFGNHEVMNMMDQTHYIAFREVKTYYKGSGEMAKKVWDPLTGYLGNRILSTFLPILQIGDLVFVHAGMTPAVAAGDPTGGKTPGGWWSFQDVHKQFVDGIIAYKRNDQDGVRRAAWLLEGNNSPVWTRVLSGGYRETKAICSQIKEAHELRNITRQFVGHTPTRSSGIELRCDNSYVMMDTGSSRWMGGVPNALRITTSRAKELKYNQDLGIYWATRSHQILTVNTLPEYPASDAGAMKPAEVTWTQHLLDTEDFVCYEDRRARKQVLCPNKIYERSGGDHDEL